jgi:5-methylcytosine-specific restriction endonuclease McrA
MTCIRCGVALPPGSRRTKVYCGKTCYNAAYRAAGRGATQERQREYGRASYRRRRAALLAELGERNCRECGEPLPSDSRLRKEFCSRRCINQVSLRERAHERHEAAQRRRARIFASGGPGIMARDWERLKARHDHRCAYCLKAAPLTMDHVVPLSRGGWHAIGNILPACRSCNSSKRGDLLIYWRTGRALARFAA